MALGPMKLKNTMWPVALGPMTLKYTMWPHVEEEAIYLMMARTQREEEEEPGSHFFR